MRKLKALFLATVLLLSACSEQTDGPPSPATSSFQPSAEWITQILLTGDIEPRLNTGFTESGFYQPYLNFDWTLQSEQKASLTSQSRFIYLMAVAYEIFGEARYLEALKKAADFLITNFPMEDSSGRLARFVDREGKALQASFHTYGHAHAIFALAHAFKLTGDTRYRNAAFSTLFYMNFPQALANEHRKIHLRGLNATMHCFEALLVLYKATGDSLVKSELFSLGRYIVEYFYVEEGGFFVEWLSKENLKPRIEDEIRLGHNAEMAFLLSRAVAVGLSPDYLVAANRALQFVVKAVSAQEKGMIVHAVNQHGTTLDKELLFWAQAELLRSLAHFIVERGQFEYKPVYDLVFTQVKQDFMDREHGGWLRFPDQPKADKGNAWVVGYHGAMMLTELLRLQGFPFHSGPEILL